MFKKSIISEKEIAFKRAIAHLKGRILVSKNFIKKITHDSSLKELQMILLSSVITRRPFINEYFLGESICQLLRFVGFEQQFFVRCDWNKDQVIFFVTIPDTPYRFRIDPCYGVRDLIGVVNFLLILKKSKKLYIRWLNDPYSNDLTSLEYRPKRSDIGCNLVTLYSESLSTLDDRENPEFETGITWVKYPLNAKQTTADLMVLSHEIGYNREIHPC